MIIRSLKSQPCADCGKTFHYAAMDFDHVRDIKRVDISRMIRTGYSVAAIEQELKKCEVVCANCHRIRTWSRWPESQP